MAKPLSLEVAAYSAALEGRRLRCIGAVHPSRLPTRRVAPRGSHLRMTDLAPRTVIATRNSLHTSLRAKRSNPEPFRGETLDCFVASVQNCFAILSRAPRNDVERAVPQPRRFAFAAMAIRVRWAMAAARVDCLRVSSAAVASCSMIAASRATLKLRSAVSTAGFREKCRRG